MDNSKENNKKPLRNNEKNANQSPKGAQNASNGGNNAGFNGNNGNNGGGRGYRRKNSESTGTGEGVKRYRPDVRNNERRDTEERRGGNINVQNEERRENNGGNNRNNERSANVPRENNNQNQKNNNQNQGNNRNNQNNQNSEGNKNNNRNNNSNSRPNQNNQNQRSNNQQPKKGKEEESDEEEKTEQVQEEAIPMSGDRFADAKIHDDIKRAITEGLKFEFMTPIQSLINKSLTANKDCFGQARTGTGKTIAFLIPALQSLIDNWGKSDKRSIQCLILSPTRELALQIAKDARTLTKFLPQFHIQSVIGGTKMSAEEKRLEGECQILIATPGRMCDHLNNPMIGKRLSGIKTLIFDEADRLLEIGFLPQVKQIMNALPDRKVADRQTLLFSATLGNKVKQMVNDVLKPEYEIIKAIEEGEAETHEAVPQAVMEVPFAKQVSTAVSILKVAYENEEKEYPLKAVVFCTTARGTQFVYEVLQNIQLKGGLAKNIEICQVQSRMAQGARTSNNQQFTKCVRGILVSSDVSARGVDFPKVTHVIQIGIPVNEDQYVHRLGRTGRAGREGEGVLLLDPIEMHFKDKLIRKKGIQFQAVNHEDEVRKEEEKCAELAQNAVKMIGDGLKGQTFSAWVGFYKGIIKDLQVLVKQANDYSKYVLGCSSPPSVTSQFIGKSGLNSVKHLFSIDDSKQKSKRPQANRK